jgi:predicted Zn-dependent peptidase
MTPGPALIVVPVSGAASAALGAWVRSGSAHEPVDRAGITHLLEHLLLRRCGRRTPDEIAELLDALGGDVDAFTTRETCAVTSHVTKERFAEALALTFDALFRPHIEAEDLESERGVIAAEFDLVRDSPGEVAAERALVACWGSHPLARPVLGDRGVVRGLGRGDVERFHAERFTAENLVLVAVGAVDEGLISDEVARLPRGGVTPPVLSAPRWRPAMMVEERRGLEQVYVHLALPALPSGHPDEFILGVLHQLLGAGNSSRLFRELRDRLGLVYEIDSSVYAAAAAGLLEVTFSAPVAQADACWRAVLRVLEGVGQSDITDHEVALAKQALASGLVLGTEGVDALMEAYAGEMLARGRRFDRECTQRELDEVTPDRVRALARDLVRLDLLAGAVCGPRQGTRLPSVLRRRVA